MKMNMTFQTTVQKIYKLSSNQAAIPASPLYNFKQDLSDMLVNDIYKQRAVCPQNVWVINQMLPTSHNSWPWIHKLVPGQYWLHMLINGCTRLAAAGTLVALGMDVIIIRQGSNTLNMLPSCHTLQYRLAPIIVSFPMFNEIFVFLGVILSSCEAIEINKITPLYIIYLQVDYVLLNLFCKNEFILPG